MSVELVSGDGLTKHFPLGGGLFAPGKAVVHAVDSVSLSIGEGETLACVGESGCGKSTLGRMLIRLVDPTAGTLRFAGEDITNLGGNDLRMRKRNMQIIFQDPYASLDPRMRVRDIVGEPLRAHGIAKGSELEERVGELLAMVGLGPRLSSRYPHMFSGGQRQRIGIARALALDPRFIVCDEPVSALDVSIQSQIVNLLIDLRERKNLAYFLISHDLGVVRHIADRVMVMFLGVAMEYGPTDEVYASPLHPYTWFLMQAAPVPDPLARRKDKPVLQGEIPSPVNPPPGCRFHTRCPFVGRACRETAPALVDVGGGRSVACHHPLGDRQG